MIQTDVRHKMNGRDLLYKLPEGQAAVVFFDPQYRGVLDKLQYGNEGQQRGRQRAALPQMTENEIGLFLLGIDRVLRPSGHLFLWVDKFHLCEGITPWLTGTQLRVVDLIVWDKQRFGMGYRSRRICEYMLVLQKEPKKAKGVWKTHNIPDVWREKVVSVDHPHRKPPDLQAAVLQAVSEENDIVVDPAAGSFVILEIAQKLKRRFIGCDLLG